MRTIINTLIVIFMLIKELPKNICYTPRIKLKTFNKNNTTNRLIFKSNINKYLLRTHYEIQSNWQGSIAWNCRSRSRSARTYFRYERPWHTDNRGIREPPPEPSTHGHSRACLRLPDTTRDLPITPEASPRLHE